MYQLTPKSKWRTCLHCCNCAKSEGEAGILSQMATGWEEACLRMNALAAEGHSHVATSAEQKRHENLWRISLNSPRSNTSTTFPNVPTVKRSWQIFMRRKREAVAARQVFHSHIPVENRIRQSQKQKCNLKERVRRSWRHRASCCLVRQLWFIVGELVVFIRLKTSGTAHFVLSQRCRRVSLAQNSDLHESVGWKDDVSSTLAAVVQHTHVLSRVLWLEEQHWCSQPLRAGKNSSSFAPRFHPCRYAARLSQHLAPPHLRRGPQGELQSATRSGPFGRLANQSPLTGVKVTCCCSFV